MRLLLIQAMRRLLLRLQPRDEVADAPRVDAEIGLADAALGADVDAAARALGADAHHDVVVEAEPLAGCDGLQAPGGRRAPHTAPVHPRRHRPPPPQRLLPP